MKLQNATNQIESEKNCKFQKVQNAEFAESPKCNQSKTAMDSN